MSTEHDRFPHTSERERFETLTDLRLKISDSSQNINNVREQLRSSISQLGEATVYLDGEIEVIRKEVIKQVQLNKDERKAVRKTLDEPSKLKDYLSTHGITDPSGTIKEFLIRVFQITAFEGEWYDEIGQHSMDALELSDQLRDIPKPPRTIINGQLEILEKKLKEIVPEFEEFEKEPDDELGTELNLIDDELWKQGINDTQRETILKVWENLDHDDKESILEDSHTGYATASILARRLGVRPNEQIKKLSLALYQAVKMSGSEL